MKVTDPTRRKVLVAAAGSGFAAIAAITAPQTWTTPVVKAIVLPAHAQMTTEEENPFSITCTIVGTLPTVSPPLFNVVVTGAVAGPGDLSNIDIDIVFLIDGSEAGDDSFQTDANGEWNIQFGSYDGCDNTIVAVELFAGAINASTSCSAPIECGE